MLFGVHSWSPVLPPPGGGEVEFAVAGSAQELVADGGVGFHDGAFRGGEGIGLEEDVVRDGDLAGVVERAAARISGVGAPAVV